MAVVEAAKILRKPLNPFVQYLDLGPELPEGVGEQAGQAVGEDLEQKLSMSITDLDLSVRALHCLVGQEIETVRDLVRYSPSELLDVRNFGRTSLTEVKGKLEELGLSLGMELAPEEASTT